MAATVLILFGLQILLTAPGCLSSRNTWQEDAERSSPEPVVTPTSAMCSLLRCPDLTADRLRDCQARRCAPFTEAASDDAETDTNDVDEEGDVTGEGRSSDDHDACVQRRCAGRRAMSLRACAYVRCGLREERWGSRGRGGQVAASRGSGHHLSDAAVKRLVALAKRGGLKGLWPDEFETRMVERALWPDEYETRNVERRHYEESEEDAGAGHHHGGGNRGIDPGSRALVRRARSEVTMEEPVAGPPVKSELKSVQKRWSTRLCMESHCKNAHSKVQYFMCGKAYCHR